MVSPRSAKPGVAHWISLLALVVAGEAVFALPFVLARVFRPTLLDALHITNLELGSAMSVYGVVAMLSYAPGGPLADRLGPRKLMAASLLLTAVGGIWYGRLPSLTGLTLLFGYWGCTTILLFWAPLIRATRQWGGEDAQGRAFGLLDGGRGLFAAVLATATVALFGALLPADVQTATLAERTAALQQVIAVFSAVTAGAAVLVWFGLASDGSPTPKTTQPDSSRAAPADGAGLRSVLANPQVWLQGAIVICAYVGYKSVDDLGLFAREVFDFNDLQAAQIGTLAFWVRPIAALGAGLLGDRLGGPRTMVGCFGLMLVAQLAVATGVVMPTWPWTLFAAVFASAAAVYGLRGLYFAVFKEAGVSTALTGTAAGVVSVVGYTPDIFMGPLMGWCTDTWPGGPGHRVLFAILAGFSALGVLVTVLFARRARA